MRWPEIFRIKVPGLSCLHAWNGSWFGEEDMKCTGSCCDSTRAFSFGAAGFRSLLLRFIWSTSHFPIGKSSCSHS